MVMTPKEKLVAWWRGQEADAVRKGESMPDKNLVLYHWSGISITVAEMRELVEELESDGPGPRDNNCCCGD